MSIQYKEIPNQFTASSMLARLVDTIKVRYQLATDGLTQSNIEFRATPESMSMMELQKHILLLLKWVSKSIHAPMKKKEKAIDFEDFRRDIVETCEILYQHLLQMDDDSLSSVTIYLKRDDTHYPVWYIINGPLSDAMHHIGQIVTWRRIDGNPVAKISPFTAKSY